MYAGVKSLIKRGQKVKGTVLLMQKNVLDINDITSATSTSGLIKGGFKVAGGITNALIDTYTSGWGRSVAFRLISATATDGNNVFTFVTIYTNVQTDTHVSVSPLFLICTDV